MKTLKDYVNEASIWAATPAPGDVLQLDIAETCLVETYIVDTVEDGVVIYGDNRIMELLEEYGIVTERIARYGAVGTSAGMGWTTTESSDDVYKDQVGESAMGDIDIAYQDYKAMTPAQFLKAYGMTRQEWFAKHQDLIKECATYVLDEMRGRAGFAETVTQVTTQQVPAAQPAGEPAVGVRNNEPTQADESTKIYVKDSVGNVKHVKFDRPTKIEKAISGPRDSVRARHCCENLEKNTKSRSWFCCTW